MPNSDFHQLSPIEFEELTLDLLQAEMGITFEKFSTGCDQGIDLRYSKSLEGKTKIIVQCKHYVKSTWNKLKNKLQKESENVKALNPERYMICTSQDLTPHKKDEIIQIFRPYIKNTADIFGKDDLNNLLSKYPDIEKRNFKLWFTSTDVVQQILNNALYTFSEFTEDDIFRTINTYVKTEHYELALKLIQENKCCILVGDPGVGKTTLAKMIIFQYLQEGYELIVCSEDISEGIQLYNPIKPQIFYYDDFLGQTAFTQLGKNEETRLSHFFNQIKASSNKAFILTSRDYILQRGLKETELLNADLVEILSLIIDINNVSTINKGVIFYNHLYFSELEIDYIESIIKDRAYLKVINHRNYSPRLIKTMTDINYLKKNSITSENYPQEFISNLDNPKRIWEIAFSSHIDDNCRNILYSLIVFRYGVEIKELYEFVNKSLSAHTLLWKNYKKCLDILDGTFIKSRPSRFHKGKIVIAFHSPSIQDFMENQLVVDKKIFEILLKNSSESQIVNLLRNTKLREIILENKELNNVIKDISWNIYSQDGLTALKILAEYKVLDIQVLGQFLDEIVKNIEYFIDDFSELLEFIYVIIQKDHDDIYQYQLEKIVKRLVEDEDSFTSAFGKTDPYWVIHNFYCVISFLDSVKDDYHFRFSNLENQFEEIIDDNVDYYSSITLEDFSMDTSPDTDEVEFCGWILEIDTEKLISILDELLYQNDELEKLEKEENIDHAISYVSSIDNLFSTLLEN